MRRIEHKPIPIPDDVLERQAILRQAREATGKLYGYTRPYPMGSYEYDYFVAKLWSYSDFIQ
jgi:hypothetical protein